VATANCFGSAGMPAPRRVVGAGPSLSTSDQCSTTFRAASKRLMSISWKVACLPVGARPCELAAVCIGASHPVHGFVPLGDLVFNDSLEVGEGLANLGNKLPHALDARSGLRAGDVVNDVGGDKFGDHREVPWFHTSSTNLR
jgi:hypothetical protein